MFPRTAATIACLLATAALLWHVPTAGAATSPATAQGQITARPVDAIATLDLSRYMGQWYEIAKYPNWFQKQCVAETVAQYTLLASGRVRVTNRCRLANGEMDEAIGTARQVGPANSPKLQVRFAPAWLSFIPAVWGDYWVLDLDPAYRLVAVGEPSRKYLWVLARTPSVSTSDYQALLRRLEARGFDVKKLELTRQKVVMGSPSRATTSGATLVVPVAACAC